MLNVAGRNQSFGNCRRRNCLAGRDCSKLQQWGSSVRRDPLDPSSLLAYSYAQKRPACRSGIQSQQSASVLVHGLNVSNFSAHEILLPVIAGGLAAKKNLQGARQGAGGIPGPTFLFAEIRSKLFDGLRALASALLRIQTSQRRPHTGRRLCPQLWIACGTAPKSPALLSSRQQTCMPYGSPPRNVGRKYKI